MWGFVVLIFLKVLENGFVYIIVENIRNVMVIMMKWILYIFIFV